MSKANSAPGKPGRAKSNRIEIMDSERTGSGKPLNNNWRHIFLKKLAETSNVSASAEHSDIDPSLAYRVRRTKPEFAAQWREALREGYEHLELEMLGYLRGHAPERKLDVANGIRLLSAHRATVAQMRALEDNADEQEVLDSIDAMIDEMRQRSAKAQSS